MRSSLGMATGAAGVGSALVHTSEIGTQTVEYRYVSADSANTDLGDLMRSSIRLMTTQVPSRPSTPDTIAVTYRTQDQYRSVRTAAWRQKHDVHVVPEASATLAFLRHTGRIAPYGTVAIVDLGASGTTVAVVDQADGTVLHSERSSEIGGDAVDRLVVEHVTADVPMSTRRTLDSDLLLSRCRLAKEMLSDADAPAAQIELGLNSAATSTDRQRRVQTKTLDRENFDLLVAPLAARAAEFVRSAVAASPRGADAYALVGGGAHVHAVAAAITDAAGVPTVAVDEPDAATAKGAALLAASDSIGLYPAISSTDPARPALTAKTSGAVLGVAVLGALALGYGVKEFTPIGSPDVAPAATDVQDVTDDGSTPAEPTDSDDRDDATVIPSHDPATTSTSVQSSDTFDPLPGGLWAPSEAPSWSTTENPPPTTTDVGTTEAPPTTTTTSPTSEPSIIEWPDVPTFWPTVPSLPLPDNPFRPNPSQSESTPASPSPADPNAPDPNATGPNQSGSAPQTVPPESVETTETAPAPALRPTLELAPPLQMPGAAQSPAPAPESPAPQPPAPTTSTTTPPPAG
ncbi:Hsp70 family protein [Rhodococcus sp. HNM0569]|uniref:Hsp70 family protein n=1 Tax=Rhodococcus sp. HNM0569 TaxID=2716340 RepID=UPI00146B10D5|nr:Hsp70 family protein [Rhodococcus sp. HNM0569]NLU81782.1 Hsp70 family protein [Rhodococcus sp. HNM0569]